MSFFNIFGRRKPISNTETIIDNPPVDSAETIKMVDKNLFVENQVPESKNSLKKQPNPVEIFLDQKFAWQGYNDGYEQPEAEYLESKLKLIRSEFRLAIDRSLDIRRSEVGELRLHLIQTSGISNRLEAQLTERIKQSEAIIHELDTQKILSVEDEGMVGPAVQAYRTGFIRGLKQYQQEKLFAGSTGLFNQ